MSEVDTIQGLADSLKKSGELKKANEEAAKVLEETQKQIVAVVQELSALRLAFDKEKQAKKDAELAHIELTKLHKNEIVDLQLLQGNERRALEDLKASIEKEKSDLADSHAELDKKKEGLNERIKTNSAVVNEKKEFIESAKKAESDLEAKRVFVNAEIDAQQVSNRRNHEKDAELTQREHYFA